MNGRGVVDLVDRGSGVHNVRLDGFFLNDWLDVFMDMMMNVFARHGRVGGGRVFGAVCSRCILVLGSVSLECLAHLVMVAMVNSLLLDR
jgi:hypothetical protein